ncbi:hypothetical protein [Acanthopleuribacter pedis]
MKKKREYTSTLPLISGMGKRRMEGLFPKAWISRLSYEKRGHYPPETTAYAR